MERQHKKYVMDSIPFEEITLGNICGTRTTQPVSYWAPRREEIQRFVEIAKLVHNREGRPKVLDVGCGNGFLAYLLARTGEVDVVGLDPEQELISSSVYSHPNLRLEVGDSRTAVERYRGKNLDLVLNSWMPYGLDLTPDIRNIQAKAIAYISEYNGATGVYRVSCEPGKDYKRVFGWVGPSLTEVQDIAKRFEGDSRDCFSSSGFDYNDIDIQFRKDVPLPKEVPRIQIPDSEKYRWERELERKKSLREMEFV
jgi:SAM-dependent methyltransferase